MLSFARALAVFIPVGMIKNGNQAGYTSTAETQITNWLPDPAYPGSSTASGNNALYVPSGKSGATVEAQVSVNCGNSATVTIRVYQNGSLLGSGTASVTFGGIISPKATITDVTVNPGDLITVTIKGNQFTGYTPQAANTYCRVT